MDDKTFEHKIGFFLLGEKYRLELHWSDVLYEKDGECKLKNAYFSGPVLQFAEKIEPNNSMLIDFYKQYYIFAANVYIATLSWGEVVYNKDDTVTLKNAVISHDTELNRVPKFKKTDYLVIDTEGHDAETHAQYPTYNTIVVKEDGKAYNFWYYHGEYRKVNDDES